MSAAISTLQKPETPEADFWQNFWDIKAGEQTDFQATGRSIMQIPDFLFTIHEIARILELKKEDTVLDIGCGTGIIALALSPWIKQIQCIDISPKMLERTKANAADTQNIVVSAGTIVETKQKNNSHNKVLAYSVLQYLSDQSELETALNEVHRVLKPGGIALLAANPDPEKKELHIQTVQAKTDMKMKQIEMSLLDRTGWFSKELLQKVAQKAGLQASILPIHQRIWQHFYMFDIKLIKP